MSEFKYACPVCGQHLMCDSSRGGAVMECPTCFQKIIAPHASAASDPKFILTGTKVSERPGAGIAGASNRPVAARTKGFPGAAMVLLIFLFIAGAVGFVYRGTLFKSEPAPATSSASHNGTDVVSVPEADAAAGSNLALNKPALASSQQDQNPVSGGNDGNEQTRWCANSDSVPQWWEVDLGRSDRLTSTQILWEQNAAYKYLIQVSSDNRHWVTLVDQTANPTPARINSDNFSASGRYVRVVVTGLVPGVWASFCEFRAYGSVANATNALGHSARRL